jgi:hypothetical protein
MVPALAAAVVAQERVEQQALSRRIPPLSSAMFLLSCVSNKPRPVPPVPFVVKGGEHLLLNLVIRPAFIGDLAG